MIMVCLLAMMAASLNAKAQEVTITLYPGWTWISYPNVETMDISSALGDFVPASGDIIQSQYSSSTYVNGYWRGGVTHFMPGWGYMYYSNRTEAVSFVFGEAAPQITVTTAEPTEITAISAVSGGSITSNEGNYVFVMEKGICWATHPNPTVMNDFHTENGDGINSFTAEMTDLELNTMYYLRAYAVTEIGTTYGEEMSFTTRDGIPLVSTAIVTGIEGSYATCGGTVIDNGGMEVIARGVCWSTYHNPTINDNYTINGFGLGNFTSRMTVLTMNTTYYVRAYASTSQAIIYGEEVSFVASSGSHSYVDLGLPSGTLWATCNVGANLPEEYGDYFAWGETQPKDYYDWSTYQYCNGGSHSLTRYCNSSAFGYNGFTDDFTVLLQDDDVASTNWGVDWRMPTYEEWQELYQNTTHVWTTKNGVNGQLFTSSSGDSLFLPAAGNCFKNDIRGLGGQGIYWASSLLTNCPNQARCIGFESGYYSNSYCDRLLGCSVRAVRSSLKN